MARLEYWQWISDPKEVVWCALCVDRVHGDDRQIISALHRAAAGQPEYDSDFRLVRLMSETGERTLLAGDMAVITDDDGRRVFSWNGTKWNRAADDAL